MAMALKATLPKTRLEKTTAVQLSWHTKCILKLLYSLFYFVLLHDKRFFELILTILFEQCDN